MSTSEHCVSQCQGCEVHVGHLDARRLEAAVEVQEESLPLQNVEEVALQMCSANAHGIHLQLVVNAVLLLRDVENFLLWIVEGAISVHQLDDHFLSDDAVGGQHLADGVTDAADRLSADAYEHLSDARLELSLQLLDDVREALRRFVDVVNHTFTNERRRLLLDHGEHRDAAIGLLLSGNARHLR